MAEGCKERFSFDFIKWIWEYPKKRRPIILTKLEHLSKEKEVIILQSPRDVRSFLEKVRKG